MTTQTSFDHKVQSAQSSLPIKRLVGGSAKIFGFWVPPATLASIDDPDSEGGRHACMQRVGVSLASQGMDAAQIVAVFMHMYGADPGVSADEIEHLAIWCAEHPGEPCGGPEAALKAKRASKGRVDRVRMSYGRCGSSRPAKQASATDATNNSRALLGERRLSIDGLVEQSPVPICLSPAERAASFGLLTRHLYRPEDLISVVPRAFWPRGDYDGSWQPSGYGNTRLAAVWSEIISADGVAENRCLAMPQNARLTAAEIFPLDGGSRSKETGLPYLPPLHWWASTRWGAWFHVNPVQAERGTGKFSAYTDRDIARYPYLLVENDRLPFSTQLSIIAAKGLPVASVVSSGRRSLHSLIAVDAQDEDHYRLMGAKIYDELAPFGFDRTGNPSRMTRMPGVLRRDELPSPGEPRLTNEFSEIIRGKQMLLWLAKDHRGAPLPWSVE